MRVTPSDPASAERREPPAFALEPFSPSDAPGVLERLGFRETRRADGHVHHALELIR